MIYLAGPMSNHYAFNYPKFHEVANDLRDLGMLVINPAENFGGDASLEYEKYLAEAEKQIRTKATAICLLPGWETSSGAKRELAIALELRLPVMLA